MVEISYAHCSLISQSVIIDWGAETNETVVRLLLKTLEAKNNTSKMRRYQFETSLRQVGQQKTSGLICIPLEHDSIRTDWINGSKKCRILIIHDVISSISRLKDLD